LNEAILKRTRLWTLVAGAALAVVLGFAVSVRFAAGLFVTALWAVVGFRVLEGLIRAALVPRGARRNVWVIVAWGAAKLAIYGFAVWAVLTRPFPAASHLIGFSLLLVVLVVVGVTSLPRGGNQPAQRGDNG